MTRRALLALRIWSSFMLVLVERRRLPLPVLVARLAGGPPLGHVAPGRYARAVDRALTLGPWRPRCLTRSLVLYRLLRRGGHRAEIVVGLPRAARTRDAHAWVEIDGRDVGPAPGRSGHDELARYGDPPGSTDSSSTYEEELR